MNNYKLPLSIDSNLANEIKNFALQNYIDRDLFNYNGNERQYCCLNKKRTIVSDQAVKFREVSYKQIGIKWFKEEPIFGIFLGVIHESGFVHKHKDPTEEGFYHTRINFLLSKPHQGGLPIINRKEFEVNEGECWLNVASEWGHSSTPVVGSKPRVVLSLGALVRKEDMNPILKEMGIE